ncbi:MAG TPA: DUF1223 domain-containing protein [Thermoanaerobaculia bacterium]|nr:DUF1223 domain-containing protein [Thermoanaerobaculia bacterium]
MLVSSPFLLSLASMLLASTAQRPNAVLVELFTSEGCSSCPPADRLLAKLRAESPLGEAVVVPLSLHVDYWNRLGWNDPYSSSAYSARQAVYAERFSEKSVYTPQMVVDGAFGFVGNDESRAREALRQAARMPKASLTILRDDAGRAQPGGLALRVRVEDVPPVSPGDTAEVIFVLTEDGIATNVKRGENAGRTLPHTAVVRQLSLLGRVQPGKAFEMVQLVATEKSWKAEALSAVVFVQERRSRRVLGATRLPLPRS